MPHKHRKGADGKYHIHGKKYDQINGSRAQVMHGTAYKTAGMSGLKKKKLMYNKHGRVVSKMLHHRAKTQKRLSKAGYSTKKGVFGAFKDGKKVGRTRRRRRSRR